MGSELALRIRIDEPGCRVGTVHHVAVSVWTEMPTVRRLDALDRAIREALAHGDPVGGLHLIRIPSLRGGSIDEPIRAAIERLYVTSRGHRGAVALVLDAEGFAAAAFRSLFSSVLLLSRGTLTQRVFGDVPSAITWLVSLVSREERAPAASLREALRGAMQTLEAR